MPSVAVRSSPNGLPIAIAGSPTLHVARVGELERLDALRDAAGVDASTARSLDGSVPSTSASIDVAVGPKRTTTRLLPFDHVVVGHDRAVVPIRKPVPEPSLVLIETTAGLAAA